MMDRRGFLLGGLAFLAPVAGWAQSTLSAEEANAQVQAGQMILIDVRTPQEWQQTGVAEGAWPLDMTQPDFGSWLLAAIERNPDRKIAIICRTGNRTGRLMQALAQNGIDGVLDVSEGMAGGPRGTGWIPSSLPITTADAAYETMPKDLVAH